MDTERLIEAMARAVHAHLCRRDIMQYLDNPEDCEGVATAAYTALRETLEPLAYAQLGGETGLLHALSPVPHSATPTPLVALPELKP